MAKNQLKRCLWVLDTIYRTGGISYKELAARWERERDPEDLDTLSNSTFRSYITLLQDLFDINIECIASSGYKYRITSDHDLEGHHAKSWLLSTFAVNNTLGGNRALEGRVIYEDIPSGQHHLLSILDAMRLGREIDIIYTSFNSTQPKFHHVQPYAVKINQRRWYLLCKYPDKTDTPIPSKTSRFFHLALDRISRVDLSDTSFSIDPTFDPDNYYADAFGVITGMEEDYDVEDVRIKVYNDYHRADYLHTLPIHHSQTAIQSTPEYTIYQYRLRPTDDFLSAILALGADAEVLSPQWYREYVQTEITHTSARYTNPCQN